MSIAVSDYSYYLPKKHIANQAIQPRDHSRLMVLDINNEIITHQHFYDLAKILGENDVLVLNQSKVFPARLLGKKETGGKVELLLLKELQRNVWLAISKPGLKNGQKLFFSAPLTAQVIERKVACSELILQFDPGKEEFLTILDKLGTTPIPPYIKNHQSEKSLRRRYQTVYAKELGSAAAPTAGLHFTQSLLRQLENNGVQIEYVTLHVGLGTFQPVKTENLKTGKLHQEFYEITPQTAQNLNQAKQQGKRIIAVGTTATRTLESAAVTTIDKIATVQAAKTNTEIFIYPPYQFKFVDALITNFHLPNSSLLMLISALTTYPQTKKKFQNFHSSFIGQAYQEAIKHDYRFFSFGDAMFIF